MWAARRRDRACRPSSRARSRCSRRSSGASLERPPGIAVRCRSPASRRSRSSVWTCMFAIATRSIAPMTTATEIACAGVVGVDVHLARAAPRRPRAGSRPSRAARCSRPSRSTSVALDEKRRAVAVPGLLEVHRLEPDRPGDRLDRGLDLLAAEPGERAAGELQEAGGAGVDDPRVAQHVEHLLGAHHRRLALGEDRRDGLLERPVGDPLGGVGHLADDRQHGALDRLLHGPVGRVGRRAKRAGERLRVDPPGRLRRRRRSRRRSGSGWRRSSRWRRAAPPGSPRRPAPAACRPGRPRARPRARARSRRGSCPCRRPAPGRRSGRSGARGSTRPRPRPPSPSRGRCGGPRSRRALDALDVDLERVDRHLRELLYLILHPGADVCRDVGQVQAELDHDVEVDREPARRCGARSRPGSGGRASEGGPRPA